MQKNKNVQTVVMFIFIVYIIFTSILIYKLSSERTILIEKVGQSQKLNIELLSELRTENILRGNPNFITK